MTLGRDGMEMVAVGLRAHQQASLNKKYIKEIKKSVTEIAKTYKAAPNPSPFSLSGEFYVQRDDVAELLGRAVEVYLTDFLDTHTLTKPQLEILKDKLESKMHSMALEAALSLIRIGGDVGRNSIKTMLLQFSEAFKEVTDEVVKASIKIQSTLRQRIARKRVGELKAKASADAATTIQKMVRARQARGVVSKKRAAKAKAENIA